MTARARRFTVLSALVFVVLSAFAASAQAVTPQMDISDFKVKLSDYKVDWGVQDGNPNTGPDTTLDSADDNPADVTGAGRHPYVNMMIRYCDPDTGTRFAGSLHGCSLDQGAAQTRDLTVHLPAGMIGNPSAVPACPYTLLSIGGQDACKGSIIGFVTNFAIQAPGGIGSVPLTQVQTALVNVQTFGLEPARLGTNNNLGTTPPGPLPIQVSVRDGDLGIDSLTADTPKIYGASSYLKLVEQDIVLYSKAPVHYIDPNTNQEAGINSTNIVEPLPGAHSFMSNPTSCGAKQFGVEVNSWQDDRSTTADDAANQDSATQSVNVDGCDNDATRPPLDSNVTVAPDLANGGTDQAGAPSAYKVNIHLPDSEDAPIHGSHLKDATVTLPQGVTLAAAAGNGLAGCDAAQFGAGNSKPPTCPSASKIGDVEVQTPILGSPLTGAAYFGTPGSGPATPANPWKLYLLIEGSGVRVKLAGDVTVDQSTGQIKTVFHDNPQVPFTDLTIHLKGGDQAVLNNPTGCGPHEGTAELTGWSGDSDVTHPSVTVSGCNDDPPFAPSVSAHADNDDAGALSTSHLGVDRPDGNARMRKLSLALPAGLVGSLKAAPLCSAGDAVAGTCSEQSKVGNLSTTLGYAGSTLKVPGSLYLADGTEPGDVASLSAVIPAKIGPIDLGNVVIVNHIKLRGSDAGLTATTDEIPTIVGGIPLYIKHIGIDVDRPGFLTNPTGCDPRNLVGTFTSDSGKTASASVTLTARNCDRLDFGPRLRLIAEGEHGRFQHTALRAIVTASRGEANIKRAVVGLPDILRPELPTIQKSLCTSGQLAANGCPASSLVGNAVATTPLLPEPISGPIWLVQDPNPIDPLPRIVVQLRGRVALDLSARNTISGVRTINTFETVPDVPVSRFELYIKGGKPGILKNFNDLCTNPSRAQATFYGQNGGSSSTNPLLETPGCKASVESFSIVSSSARMTRKGVVPIKIRCGAQACNGKLRVAGRNKRFSIGSGRTAAVKVRLNRKTRRAVIKRKKLKTSLNVTVDQTKTTKKLTIKAPPRKRR